MGPSVSELSENAPPKHIPAPKRRWRFLSGCLVVFAAVLGLIATVVIGAAIWARTDSGGAWIRDQLLALVGPVHGTLTAGTLETDLFSKAVVHDITLTDAAGTTVGHVDTLSVSYRLGSLVAGRLVVPTVRIEGLDLTLTHGATGLEIAGMWDNGSPPSGKPYTGIGIDLVIPDVRVTDANVRFVRQDATGNVTAQYGIERGTLTGGVALVGPAVLVTALELDAPTTTPALGPLALGSDLRWDPSTLWFDRADLTLGPNHAALAGGIGHLDAEATLGVQIAKLHIDTDSLVPLLGTGPAAPKLPVTGVFDATGSVAGLLRAPTAVLEVLTPGGALHADATLDLREDRPSWNANLLLDTVSIHAFVPTVPVPTIVAGVVNVDGNGLGWPDDLEGNLTFALTAPELATLDLLTASGTARLEHGVLDVPAVHVEGPGMGVDAAGTLRIREESGTARLQTAFIELAQLSRFGAPGGRGRVSFTGNVDYGWADGVGVAARGAVRGSRVGWANILDATTVAGPVTASWSTDRGANVAAGLDLQAVVPVSAKAFSAATGRVDGKVVIAPGGALSIDGVTTLAGVVGPQVNAASIQANIALTRTSSGQMDGTADLTTDDLTVAGFRSDHGAGRASFAGDTVAVVLDLMDKKRTVLGLDGELDVEALAIRVRRLELSPNAELVWQGDGVQTLRMVDRGVENVHLRLVSGGSALAVDGALQVNGPVDLDVVATSLRLDTLGVMWPDRFTGYAGLVDVRASIDGHASEPAVALDLSALALQVPDTIRGLDLDVQAVGENQRVQLNGEFRAGSGTLARVVGDLPVSLALDAPRLLTDGDLDLRVVVPPSGSEGWSAVLIGIGIPTFRGSAEVELKGPVLDPILRVVAAVSAPVGQVNEWIRLDLDGATVDGLFGLRVVARERLERRAEVDGTVALHLRDVVRSVLGDGPTIDLAAPTSWVGAVELDVVPLRLPIQVLSSFVELPAGFTGDLSGGFHLSGDLNAPKVEGAVFLSGGRLGDAELSPALVSLVPAEGGYQVDANLGFGGASAVLVSGYIPFSPSLEVDFAKELERNGLAIEVTATDVPLAAISAAWPTLADGRGTLAVNGTVTGSLADPAPDFKFSLAEGDFSLSLTGVHYSEAAFSGEFTRDGLRIEGLHVRTSRISRVRSKKERNGIHTGTISGAVSARREGNRPVFGGELRFDRAWIFDLPAQVLRTEGSLLVADLEEKLRLTGKLAVVEGKLVVPERFFTKSSGLELDPDIQVIRTGAVVIPAAPVLPNLDLGIPDWLDLDVAVRLDRNAFLDATLPLEQMVSSTLKRFSSIQVSTQLDGELVARISNGDLSLVGQLIPVRGTAGVFGVPFDLVGDTISFTGFDYTNPVLDLVAVRRTGKYGDITTHITGTPSALDIDFSSDDPNVAQDDVLEILILGSPSDELGAGEESASSELLQAALATAASSLVKDDSSSSRAFDMFNLGVGGVQVGKRIGDKMFLLGSYNWDAEQDEENIGEVTLEVRLDRAWQFDFTTGTSGISSVGLTRKWRF